MNRTHIPSITHERAVELLKKHGNQRAAAEAAGVSRASINRALKRGGTVVVGVAPPATKSARTVSVEDIVSPHDKVGVVLGVVSKIASGQLMRDEDVRVETGINSSSWRRVRGSVRLNGHWYQMPDKSIVWGTKSTISRVEERMKEVL